MIRTSSVPRKAPALVGAATLVLASAGLLFAAESARAATVVIVNADPAGVGFNDATPVEPVGSNTATTLGGQKLQVVQWAATRLGQLLYSPIPITIEVSHDNTLYCEENAATLAAAGPAWLMRSNNNLVADHPDAPTWYPSALYHRLTGTQIFSEDVTAVFNPDLGASDCMDGFQWYYGLDNNPDGDELPFVDTVLHELTHGVGFTSLAGEDGLISELDPTSISPYFAFAHDGATGKHWWELTAEERITSSTNGLLTWTGPATTSAAAALVDGPLSMSGHLYMYAPDTYEQGSSLSHFEEATDPDLLMEPFASSELDVLSNDIDLGLEFLHDLGWRDVSCGNGIVDTDEECDEGDGNDPGADSPDECTTACAYYVVDYCPDDPDKTEPGECGCGVADTDSDEDTTPDCDDACPNDPDKVAAGICGCGSADTDSDDDGTADCNDNCPADPNKIAGGVCGCGTADTDGDDDGTADCIDGCPEDPDKAAPGGCGCGTADVDADDDGTFDCLDECPSDPGKTLTGLCGCGIADQDSDGDSLPDCIDGCPNDPAKLQPRVCGCGISDVDSDGDGTPDCNDACPNDASKLDPGTCGCGTDERDRDGDGTPDCIDGCADSVLKTAPGECGCNVPDEDSDGDGTMNCNDACVNDPNKTSRGECGCGSSDVDYDADGTPDCYDNCPGDGNKINPGECGCGSADGDSDGDGVPDCEDGCPSDRTKLSPGQCGCGTSENDRDGDGAADCQDECPTDPNKVETGECGCGLPDTDVDTDGVVDCLDACPNEPGIPSENGCLPDMNDLDEDDDDDDELSDDVKELLGDAGVEALLSDGGTLDSETLDKLEQLLGDGGLDPDDIQRELLQQALEDFTADGGAKVDLNLALPDACQCRLPGGDNHGSQGGWAGLGLLLGALLLRRRRG